MTVQDVLSRLTDSRQTGEGQWEARCPAHDDNTASLCIGQGDDGRVLVHCQAGCETRDVVGKVNLTMKDLMPSPNGDGRRDPNGRPKIVKTYGYHNESGELLYQVVRFDPKDFRQRAPKPGGGWNWSVKDVHKVPYRLPELAAADPQKPIFVCEGEKDVDNLARIDVLATCNAGGAGKWRSEYNESLRSRQVVILPDNDAPGRKHAEQVARSLQSVAASIKVVELPDLPEKGDVSDWLDAGGNVGLLLLAVKKTPEWTPTKRKSKSKPTGGAPTPLAIAITNAQEIHSDFVPIPMTELVKSILTQTDNWPRRVEDSLFYDDGEQGIRWLDGTSSLFGWLAARCGLIDWRRTAGACTKEETFCELRRQAVRYDAIESFPHHPKVDSHYYTCECPEPGDGRTLETLLDFFTPETNLDRQLLTCAFATPLWGGLPGSRPAFMFTATAGRGKGKTKAAEFVARLYGGVITVSPTEDIGGIKTRLLSPEALCKRCVLCDNVKTPRFSWGDLEALITCDQVNGKRLYVGDASRPNRLVWLLTLNGPSLSRDLAQRTVEIKLGEPTYTGSWEETVGQYIDTNHTLLIADLVAFLQRPQKSLQKHSRWGAWENAVLSRVDDPDGCAALIADRRGAVDADQEEGELVQDYFAGRLRTLNYDPETTDVFIPAQLAAEWYNAATGNRTKVTGATRALKQFRDEGRRRALVPARYGGGGARGFRWVGDKARADDQTYADIHKRIANQKKEESEF